MYAFSSFIHKIHSSDISKRLINGAFWSILGSAIGRGIILIAFIFVARIIGQNVYGQLGILRSTINMFTVFAGLGMGVTAARYIAQYRKTYPLKAGEIYALSNYLSIIVGLISAVLLILFSKTIAYHSLNDLELSTNVQLCAIVLFFTTINGAQVGALSGFEDFKSIAINTFISSLSQGILLLILSKIWRLNGCIISLGIGCVILYYLNKISIEKKLNEFNINYSFKNITKSTYNILWRFSLPSVLSSLVAVPVLWWSKTYLIHDSNYSAMASYDVAEQWSIMALFIPTAITQIILPMLSNVLVEGTNKQYIKLIWINLLINITIALCITIFIILLAPKIMHLYGKDFTDTKPLILLMIASVLMSACNVVGQIIASKGKMWIGLIFNLIWSIEVIIFTILFINKGYGAAGLAMAIMYSYILHFIAQGVYMIKFILKNNL